MEKSTAVARSAWCGEARGRLDDLAVSLSAHTGSGRQPGPWRQDVLSSLCGLRDVLVDEATARPMARGSRVVRDRSRLLADLSLQQGLLRTANDDDRILYDLRRLLVEARLHVQAVPEA